MGRWSTKSNRFGGTVVGDGQSPTGRGRGSKGRPGGVSGSASWKAAGSSRRGGREGDDGIGVCVGDSLGRARGRGAVVFPGDLIEEVLGSLEYVEMVGNTDVCTDEEFARD